ncbi:hypothetical protein PybrP1_009220 [[Pythium] brassicae (nom. inval.)]|nr:hypothetical protein PybrP1_009220 [[Pythium] brassicae (nom. inval.)]
MYWNVLQATNQALDPATIVCDFEAALQQAAMTQFCDAHVVGCYFHFLQANGRKMDKLAISPVEIAVAMEGRALDLITVIPVERVAADGTAFVRTRIRELCNSRGHSYSHGKWDAFWAYFHRTWARSFPPHLWNVSGIDCDAPTDLRGWHRVARSRSRTVGRGPVEQASTPAMPRAFCAS